MVTKLLFMKQRQLLQHQFLPVEERSAEKNDWKITRLGLQNWKLSRRENDDKWSP